VRSFEAGAGPTITLLCPCPGVCAPQLASKLPATRPHNATRCTVSRRSHPPAERRSHPPAEQRGYEVTRGRWCVVSGWLVNGMQGGQGFKSPSAPPGISHLPHPLRASSASSLPANDAQWALQRVASPGLAVEGGLRRREDDYHGDTVGSGTGSAHQSMGCRHSADATTSRDHSNRALSGWVMRFNKGIVANTTSADRANPPSMVR
jgi:hypothetical protein